MPLSYHRATFDLIGKTPPVSRAAIKALEA